MTYAEARAFFAADPATHWAAYVAGVFLVLAREKGVTFASTSASSSASSSNKKETRDSVAILVNSDVPEGKGVSSSAAVGRVACRFE